MLSQVDVLVYDIQDVGSRFYTYISTMQYAMQAAASHHLPFVVLDRPDPLNGNDVQGAVLEKGFESFVGTTHIPQRYGLTCGELARFMCFVSWNYSLFALGPIAGSFYIYLCPVITVVCSAIFLGEKITPMRRQRCWTGILWPSGGLPRKR